MRSTSNHCFINSLLDLPIQGPTTLRDEALWDAGAVAAAAAVVLGWTQTAELLIELSPTRPTFLPFLTIAARQSLAAYCCMCTFQASHPSQEYHFPSHFQRLLEQELWMATRLQPTLLVPNRIAIKNYEVQWLFCVRGFFFFFAQLCH